MRSKHVVINFFALDFVFFKQAEFRTIKKYGKHRIDGKITLLFLYT